jgi:class 3 adenylate cyclase
VLTTVLFTDAVGSDEQLLALGDRRWREHLAQHRALIRQELARYGEHEVQTVGDSFMATFDSPASAIHCACAIRAAVKAVGSDVRVGSTPGKSSPNARASSPSPSSSARV